MTRRRWLLVSVSLLILGTVSIFLGDRQVSVYPMQWVQLESLNKPDCSAISGRFLNKGEQAPTNRFAKMSAVHLGMELSERVLYSEKFTDPKWADIIVLSGTQGGGLNVAMYENGNNFFTDNFSSKDLDCQRGWLQMIEYGTNVSHMKIEKYRTELLFTIAGDQSLIMRKSYVTAGLAVFFIPYWMQTVE